MDEGVKRLGERNLSRGYGSGLEVRKKKVRFCDNASEKKEAFSLSGMRGSLFRWVLFQGEGKKILERIRTWRYPQTCLECCALRVAERKDVSLPRVFLFPDAVFQVFLPVTNCKTDSLHQSIFENQSFTKSYLPSLWVVLSGILCSFLFL